MGPVASTSLRPSQGRELPFEQEADVALEIGDFVRHFDGTEGYVFDTRDDRLRIWWADDDVSWEDAANYCERVDP